MLWMSDFGMRNPRTVMYCWSDNSGGTSGVLPAIYSTPVTFSMLLCRVLRLLISISTAIGFDDTDKAAESAELDFCNMRRKCILNETLTSDICSGGEDDGSLV